MDRVLGSIALVALLAGSPIASAQEDLQGGFGGAEPCLLDQGVDRMQTRSAACLRCHDGSRGGAFGAGRRGAHPVEVGYRPGGLGERRMRATPERRVTNLALPDGRITCLTCHDPRSHLSFRLAARIDGPVEERLCIACHTVGD